MENQDKPKFKIGDTVRSLNGREGIIISIIDRSSRKSRTITDKYQYIIRTKDGNRSSIRESLLDAAQIGDIDPISDKDFEPLFSIGDYVTALPLNGKRAKVTKLLGNIANNGELVYEITTADGNTHQIKETLLKFCENEKIIFTFSEVESDDLEQ